MSEYEHDVSVSTPAPATEAPAPSPEPMGAAPDIGAMASGARATPGPSVASSSRVQRSTASQIVQTKLAVGAADDPFEREADRVADQVVRTIRRSAMADAATTAESSTAAESEPRVRRSPIVDDAVPSATTSTSDEQIQRKAVPGLNALARPTGTWTDTGDGVFGFDTPTDADDVVALLTAIRNATRDNPMRIKVLSGIHGSEPGGGYEGGHLVGTDPIDPAIFLAEDREEEGHAGVGGWTNVLNVRNKSKETIEEWMKASSSVVVLAWCYSANTVRIWDTISADWEDGTKDTGFAPW